MRKIEFRSSDQLQRNAGACRYALAAFDRIRCDLADDEDVAAARRRSLRAAECLDEWLDAIATRRVLLHQDVRGAPEASGCVERELELEALLELSRLAFEAIHVRLEGVTGA